MNLYGSPAHAFEAIDGGLVYHSKHLNEGNPEGYARERPPVEGAGVAIHGGILGPLHLDISASAEGVALAPKIRTVLAMLLVHADQVVPIHAFMRELWRERPPATGLRTLQTYILNCRKIVSQLTGCSAAYVAREILVTGAGGYGLRSHHVRLDWSEFQRLKNLGTKALEVGDTTAGIDALDAALGLWRGDALVDAPAGPVLDAKRRFFEESRLDAIAVRADAQIKAGMHQRAVTQLAAVTREHALHEGLHAQYVRALALGGRRAEALGVLRTLRTRLVSEIGIEPGAPLRELQLAILKSEPGMV
ncbi:BTAD domain-containing putative transcriptional regulator [Streptomyces sp. NPDC002952]|uniref:AfsR/SARP family transcriptional regulator n=1 Tax=Streptomyces sp. NPDC002952 TaxID=3364673 RepID=UPI0036B8C3E4